MGLGRKLMTMISSFLKLKEIMLLALKNIRTLVNNRIKKSMKNGKLIQMRKMTMMKEMKMKIIKTKRRIMRRKLTKKSPFLHQLKWVLKIMKTELIEWDFKYFGKLHKNIYLLKRFLFFLFLLSYQATYFAFNWNYLNESNHYMQVWWKRKILVRFDKSKKRLS